MVTAAPSGNRAAHEPFTVSQAARPPYHRVQPGTGAGQQMVNWPSSLVFPGKPITVGGHQLPDTRVTRDQLATATDPKNSKCDWVLPGTPTTTCIGKVPGLVDVNVQFHWTLLPVTSPKSDKGRYDFMGAFWHPVSVLLLHDVSAMAHYT